jgi:GrpB-like predicted nucleotidyltransferase (UPF0157 family)
MTKELSEMSLDELWQLFPIILEEYHEKYKDWYAEEKNILLSCLGESKVKRISHIGSTCVKGLISKPTIDILLEIDSGFDINKLKDILTNSGWILMFLEDKPALNYIFNKGYTKDGFAEKVFHLHMRHLGDWDELYFRDLLIQNVEVAAEYGVLKNELIKSYKHNRDGYTEAKGEFIKKWTSKARELFGDKYGVSLK